MNLRLVPLPSRHAQAVILFALLAGVLLVGCEQDSDGGADVVLDTNPPAAPLDTTFGGGTGRTLLSTQPSTARVVAEDSSGRIVVAGTFTDTNGETDLAVWRLQDDGALDNTFGTGGLTTIDGSPDDPDADVAVAMRIDDTGRIVIAGATTGPATDTDLIVARLFADGTLDTNFGPGGTVTYDNDATGVKNDMGVELRIDDANRITIIGSSRDAALSDPGEVAIWRFLQSGTFDASFGSAGEFLSGNVADRPGGLMIDETTGQALGFGSRGGDLALWLLDEDGQLEVDFPNPGAGGVALVEDDEAALIGRSAEIYNPVSIVAVGERRPSGESAQMFIMRLFGDGSIDTGFGNEGILSFSGAVGASTARAAAIADSGQIVVTGGTTLRNVGGASSALSGALWLLTPQGFLDISLGGIGVVHLTDLTLDAETDARDVLIDGSNRIVIVGSAVEIGDERRAAVWRIP